MKRVGKKLEWSDEDIEILKQNADKLSFFDIGLMLGISSTSVRSKAIELGIAHSYGFNQGVVWTDEMVAYLRENYATTPVSDMADYLKVSPGTIDRKAEKLGLKKDKGAKKVYVARYVQHYKNNERNFSKQK